MFRNGMQFPPYFGITSFLGDSFVETVTVMGRSAFISHLETPNIFNIITMFSIAQCQLSFS